MNYIIFTVRILLIKVYIKSIFKQDRWRQLGPQEHEQQTTQ